MGPDVIVPVVFLVSISSVLVLRGPLGRALADRIARRAPPLPDGQTAEISAQALLELDDLKRRMAELEERQDFTERMLARERERGQVGPGGKTGAT